VSKAGGMRNKDTLAREACHVAALHLLGRLKRE